MKGSTLKFIVRNSFSSKYTEKLEKKLHQKYKDKSRDNKLSKLEIKKLSGEPTRG